MSAQLMEEQVSGGSAVTDSAERARLRTERLHLQYRIAFDLIINESKLILERGNIFLLANSILFTGFVVLLAQDNRSLWLSILAISLPVVALIVCVAQPYLIARTIEAANFWRETLRAIEEDPGFWYPGRTKADADLDIVHARRLSGALGRLEETGRLDHEPRGPYALRSVDEDGHLEGSRGLAIAG